MLKDSHYFKSSAITTLLRIFYISKLRRITCCVFVLSLCSCSMAESTFIDLASSSNSISQSADCESNSGVYFLSKSLLKIAPSDNKGASSLGLELEAIPIADRDYGVCLDYLTSYSSEESLKVIKNSKNLLTKITTNSDDKTVKIIENLANTVHIVAGGGVRTGIEIRSELPENFLIDPFNPSELAMANDALSHSIFKLCIVFSGQTELQNIDVQSYCGNPLKFSTKLDGKHPILSASTYNSGPLHPPYAKGIVYRPRLPYTVDIYRKEQSNGRYKWRLIQSAIMHFENNSPMVALGIDRTFFSGRNTSITFDNGVFKSIDIDKDSEAAAAVAIPANIAKNWIHFLL